MPKPPTESDTEVVPLPQNDRQQRRKWTVEEKARILEEADKCTERGQLAELLRREGIYSAQLQSWRAQRDREGSLDSNRSAQGPRAPALTSARLSSNASASRSWRKNSASRRRWWSYKGSSRLESRSWWR